MCKQYDVLIYINVKMPNFLFNFMLKGLSWTSVTYEMDPKRLGMSNLLRGMSCFRVDHISLILNIISEKT